MNMLARLELWKGQGAISPDQEAYFAKLVRNQPFSLFTELNILLYAGVTAFVAGLGWTVSTWSHQLGDVVVLASLTILLVSCLWYCFTRASTWSPAETPAPTLFFDYALYLGCLVWGVELVYLEERLHILSGQWDVYLLITALLFFFFAYRFDNRLVLSLALSSLAGWFGITISRWPSFENGAYREYALLYCFVVCVGAVVLQRLKFKPHFFNTYLNIVANVLFYAILSGVFEDEHYGAWGIALLIACLASLSWGLRQRQFAFVAYTAVYGYIGLSSLLLRNVHDPIAIMLYFVITAAAMLFLLVQVARSLRRPE